MGYNVLPEDSGNIVINSSKEGTMSILHNHPVLVTGSARGIGRSIALAFAREGWPVIITGRHSGSGLAELKTYIDTTYHVPCMAFSGNLGDYETVVRLFDQIREMFGGIEILVNNAGISHIGLLSDMSAVQWNELVQTNISSYFYCCKLAIPYMVARKQGRIINISSVWGNVGASCEAAYSATKGAVNSLTKALGKELAPSNIPVNAIACGVIDTEMNQFLDEEERLALMEEIPAGRFASPDEVAQLVLQLSESNSYLTGQVITFDGGWV